MPNKNKSEVTVSACESCGWINGHSDHKNFPYMEQFKNGEDICPVCGEKGLHGEILVKDGDTWKLKKG